GSGRRVGFDLAGRVQPPSSVAAAQFEPAVLGFVRPWSAPEEPGPGEPGPKEPASVQESASVVQAAG
ncbi:hypothetical protein ACN6LC_003318, partial [Streptomyces violaceoruber]